MLVLALEDLLLERDRDLIDQVGTLKARTGPENSTELLKSALGFSAFLLVTLYLYAFSFHLFYPAMCFLCVAKDEATTSSTLS